MLESARILSELETNNYFDNLISKSNEQNSKGFAELGKFSHVIFEQYSVIENDAIADCKNEYSKLSLEYKKWKDKICSCGSKLELISGSFGDYWGCPNRESNGEHTKYNERNEEFLQNRFANCRIRINHQWISQLKSKLGIPKYITSTQILEFLAINGYDDLRTKYYNRSTNHSIGGYQKGKKRADKEELELVELLSNEFTS